MLKFFLLFILINNAKPINSDSIMAKAIAKVAKICFDKPLILFLDATEKTIHKIRNLNPQEDDNENLETLKYLQRNWTILSGDQNYQILTTENVHFQLGVTYAPQIIGLLTKDIILNETELNSSILLWRQHVVWFGRAKILIAVNAEKKFGSKLALVVFSELWNQVKAAHVVLFVNHKANGTFYTWTPYSETCKIDPFVSGFYQNESSWNFSLFPKRNFTNLNQCKIVAVAAPLIPFVFPPEGKDNFFEGIEVRLFFALAEALNFSYGFKPLPPGENARMTVVDGKPAGVIGVLYRGEADLSLSGSRLTYQRSSYVDNLDAYHGDNFAWIGPIAQRVPRWKSVFLVFSNKIWICFIATFIASLIFLAFLYKLKDTNNYISKAFIAIWAISTNLGATKNQLTSISITRTFLLIYLFYVLTINALYTSALYKVLTKGLGQDPVNTAMDAAKQGMMASIFPSMVEDLKAIVPEYYKYITNRNLVNWTEDYVSCLHKAARHGDCYTLFTELVANFQINLKLTAASGKKFTRVFAERYTPFEPVFYVARHHPLLPIFRSRLKRLVECGWVFYQINSIMKMAMRNRVYGTEVSDIPDVADTIELSMDQIVGAFVPPAIVLLFAFLAFLWELFSSRQLNV